MKPQLDIFTPTEPWATFEEIYLQVRMVEGRVLTDEALKTLPNVPKNNPLYNEWKLRAQSTKYLIQALKARFDSSVKVLEVGCGNGWLSNQIHLAGFFTTGVDINLPELEQANRVFAKPGLNFAFADVFIWQPAQNFQVAVLASVLQYFENPNVLLACLFEKNPELQSIIICDSQFYLPQEIAAAKARSAEYYASLGLASMVNNYHHHCVEWLNFEIEYLYHSKKGLFGKLLGRPFFPIISVKRPL